MRMRLLAALLVLLALALSGCRFAVVEEEGVRIEAPAADSDVDPEALE